MSAVIKPRGFSHSQQPQKTSREHVQEIELKKKDLERQMELLEQNRKLLREKMELEIKMKMMRSAKSQVANVSSANNSAQNHIGQSHPL